MPGCLTCRYRKVKCDGRPNLCLRREKLGLECRWRGSPREGHSNEEELVADDPAALTQAGHKRLRASIACETCRKRKLRCDSERPSCSNCIRRKVPCNYGPARDIRSQQATPASESLDGSPQGSYPDNLEKPYRFGEEVNLRSPEVSNPESSSGRFRGLGHEGDGESDQDIDRERWNNRPKEAESNVNDLEPNQISGHSRLKLLPNGYLKTPSGSSLLPYMDSFLENSHPICCNNFLHPGVLAGDFDKAPHILVLAVCGVSSKFISSPESHEKGRAWIAEARDLMYKGMDRISTLTMTVCQYIAMHDLHEANFTSAWNLIGISIRMALQLRLNQPSALSSPSGNGTFLRQECHRRLMWAIYVCDLIFGHDQVQISEEAMAFLPLPCNLWSFTQGIPCTTMLLDQLYRRNVDPAVRQATNPCAYLIAILALRRKVISFVQHPEDFDGGSHWIEGSYFRTLADELENWRRILPPTFEFEERHMYTFRSSRHLDIFLMIHAWYHLSIIELFAPWIPGHRGSLNVETYLQPPMEFLQLCLSKSLAHARNITSLIQKVLKLEPNHPFRDAWFGICVLESTSIQITALLQEVDDGPKKEAAQLLKLNLRALTNTRRKIPLSEKIYHECCKIIVNAGFGGPVGLSDTAGTSPADMSSEEEVTNHPSALIRKYPFLQRKQEPEAEEWDQLINVTNFAGTRDPSPDRQDAVHNIRHQFEPGQLPVDMSGLGYMDPNLFYPWPTEDFNWQQPPTIDQSAAAALLGMNHERVEGDPDLIGMFAGSLGVNPSGSVGDLESHFVRR